ncbi:MAG: R3H domain-containing nucleic acid-binding protein, partial [Ktedonobacterales bacterium]
SDLVGGIQAVTLGDEEARRRGTQKTVLERKAPPTFDVLVEQENWQQVTLHRDVAAAVDEILRGHAPTAELRTRDRHNQVQSKLVVARSENTPSTLGGYGSDTLGHDMRVATADYGSGNWGLEAHLNDSRRIDLPEHAYEPDGDEEETLEIAEPTGTNGADYRHLGRQRRLRIYPFGISRDRLEQSVRQLRVPVEISRDQDNADAVMTLKTFYRRQSGQLRNAESERKPIYILRTNTVAQMQECLARIFELRQKGEILSAGDSRNLTLQVMEATENAIHHMLNHNTHSVELEPQNAYVRRLQHQIAGRYNLESHSHGKEPNRRVQIFCR